MSNCNFWRGEKLPCILADMVGQKKVLEIFAGNGSLAAKMAELGTNITPTSIFSGYEGNDINSNVVECDAVSAVAQYGEEHDILLIVWPIVTKDVFLAAQLWGTSKEVIFIGEVTSYKEPVFLGGCATDEFFEHLVIEKDINYPSSRMFEKLIVGKMSLTPHEI